MLAFFFITLKPGVLKEDFPQLLRTVSVVAARGGAEGQYERSVHNCVLAHIVTLDSNHDWGWSACLNDRLIAPSQIT
jgi:hypothetical protein